MKWYMRSAFYRSLLGKPLSEAEQLSKDANRILRVSRIDGKAQVLTRDVVANRFNVEVKDGVVVQIQCEG